jgi:parallel beta-helix repeat protein
MYGNGLDTAVITGNIARGGGIKLNLTESGNEEPIIRFTVSNNVIDIGGKGSKPLNGDYGIAIEGAANVTVSSNVIYNAVNQGIYIAASEDSDDVTGNVITGNSIDTVYGTNDYGIQVVTTNTFSNNVISNNYITNIGEDTDGTNVGIRITPGDTDNNVGNLISGNVIDDSQEQGMYLERLTDSKILGNMIRNCGVGTARPAIYANDLNYCTISNNDFVGVGTQMSYGYQEVSSNNNWILNNFIKNAVSSMVETSGLGASTKVENNWDGVTEGGIGTLEDNATPSVDGYQKWLTGGTTTITDFDDGRTGDIIYIIAEHTITITDGTNIFLSGSANFEMTATDTLTLICKADNKWYELSRGDNGA